MILSKISGKVIYTFTGIRDMIGYFIAVILFWAIILIVFSLFMSWFLENPEGHIMNGLNSIQVWIDSKC